MRRSSTSRQARRLFGDPVQHRAPDQERIRERTGLTASVGVAANKLVAKISSDLAKPDGLTVVPRSGCARCSIRSRCGACQGSGTRPARRVEEAGIRTFADLRAAPDATAVAFVRPLHGARASACGGDRRPARADRPRGEVAERRGHLRVSTSPTRRCCAAQLSRIAELACERLRTKQLMTGCIGVKIRRHDFTTFTRQRAVAPPDTRWAYHRQRGKRAHGALARRACRCETSAAGGGLD